MGALASSLVPHQVDHHPRFVAGAVQRSIADVPVFRATSIASGRSESEIPFANPDRKREVARPGRAPMHRVGSGKFAAPWSVPSARSKSFAEARPPFDPSMSNSLHSNKSSLSSSMRRSHLAVLLRACSSASRGGDHQVCRLPCGHPPLGEQGLPTGSRSRPALLRRSGPQALPVPSLRMPLSSPTHFRPGGPAHPRRGIRIRSRGRRTVRPSLPAKTSPARRSPPTCSHQERKQLEVMGDVAGRVRGCR